MTRYPKKGKGSKWTALELKNIPAIWKDDKLSEEGLQGEVRVSTIGDVYVRWQTAYKWDSKLKWYYCGQTPQDSLEHIREQRDWCKEQVKSGVNPSDRKKLNKIEARESVEQALAAAEAEKARERPLNALLDDWLERGVNREDGNAELRRMLDKDVRPRAGSIPVRLVDERILSDIVKAITERGSHRMAVVVHNMLVQVYGWAEVRQPWRSLIHDGQGGNPMEVVEISPLLPRDYDMDNVSERVLAVDELILLKLRLNEAREAFRNAPNKRTARQPLEATSEHAVWLCLGTLCRIGELSMAEWKHVDFTKRTWFIPKENTKKTRGNPRRDHIVYLSDFSLKHFQALFVLTGEHRFVFPSINDSTKHRDVKAVTKQVGDRQARFKTGKKLAGRSYHNSLVLGEEAWSPHDMRRTGATLMQELGVSMEVIDRCQNHVIAGSKVRRHYLKYDYAKQKAEAWDLLGNHLEQAL